ncbi:MAG: carotenoid oxygenase family protein [Pseudomonadales bacterium]|nr:carotenoid oxygenase family protein [Pseudomonadales bacterium]
MSKLAITERYGKALGNGTEPQESPEWISDIDNPWLHGLFAPTTVEMSCDELEIEGEIPKDLVGGYFRNGTNPRFKPTNRYHWFDGDGMIYAIRFRDGKAVYQNKWIETKAFTMESEKGDAIWPGVLGPFDFNLPISPIKDTANTDLVFINNKLCGLWYESGAVYQLDPFTLETVGTEDFNGQLNVPLSAHSKVDPNSGDLIFFSYGDRKPYMRYGAVTPDNEVHITEVELPGPRRPHDVGVTENYSILHDFPIFHDESHFKKTGKRVPYFHPDVATRFGVIPRFGNNEDIKWFEFKPCYMLHVINCWEEGDWVVQVGCRTDNPNAVKPKAEDGDIAGMIAFLTLQANIYEWRMNTKTGETIERSINELNVEFPYINRHFMGRKNRYSYLQYIPYEAPATFDALVKFDIETGSFQRFDYGDGIFGSEAPFAPKPNAKDEDDGYVVTFVTDTNNWKSSCWIFDAKDIEKGPICKISIPHRLPAGFHTLWVDGKDLYSDL